MKTGSLGSLARISLLAAGLTIGWALAATPPGIATPELPVTDRYGAVAVADPYRWLENGADPQVQAWSHEQDARTRAYLDALPFRQPLYERLMKQISAASSAFSQLYPIGSQVFALYNQPPKQQPMIALLGADLDPDQARILVDPNAIDPKGTTAIDWWVPSPDGRTLAVSMSENGSEDGSIHLFDVASGRQVDTVIPRAQYPTGGGSLAWRADSKGFWYTRYPGPDRPASEQHFFQQLYFHVLGADPGEDRYVLGKDFPKVAEIALDTRQNPRYVTVSVANGDGGEFAHFVIGPDGRLTQVTRFEDQVVAAIIGPDDSLYLVSHRGAPRGKILKLPLDDLNLAHARLIVPESAAVIQPGGEFGGEPLVVTGRSLYVREILGGPSRVAIYSHDGAARGNLPLPDVAAVEELAALGEDTVIFSVQTYLRPTYFARYQESAGQLSETRLAQTSPVSFADTEVLRVMAPSRDGTQVPLNIVRRRDTALDGAQPLLLTGYGGFNINQTPAFLGPRTRLWLDAGGIYVIANLRGGGEYGEQWHRQGALTHKQNVFDDFTGAARYLIAQHYTGPGHLAIIGGSNGGLLMGAAFTQHPELFRAVVAQVGIYDMLRVELDPNGAFNTSEYGTVRDPAQFKALYAYSPYHHVKRGGKYPAIFMSTGENDGRVNPMQSRKMIARLQGNSASGLPVFLSINSHAGHGMGSSLAIRVGQTADAYSFLFDQLGMKLPAD